MAQDQVTPLLLLTDAAGAGLYLLSPLSTFVTGHVLRVTGGALL